MANIILPQADILMQTNQNTRFIVEQDGVLKRFPCDLSNLSFEGNGENNDNTGITPEDVNIRYIGGKAVFFGSDLTDGAENNGKSFVDYLIEEQVFDTVKKYCRSQCALGDYGLNNYSNLIDTYASDARDADFIFLELCREAEYYFNNNVSIGTIQESAMSVFNKIRTYNPDAMIYLLVPFLGFDANMDVSDFALLFEYTVIKNAITRGVAPIGLLGRMAHSENYFTNNGYLTSFGHYNAAAEIYYNLCKEYLISNSSRLVHMTGDTETVQLGRDAITYSSVDIQPRLFNDMVLNGVPVRVSLVYGTHTVEFNDLQTGYESNDYGDWFYVYSATGGGATTTTMFLSQNIETSETYGYGMVYYSNLIEYEFENENIYTSQYVYTPDGFEYQCGVYVYLIEGASVSAWQHIPAAPATIIDMAGLTGHQIPRGSLKLYEMLDRGGSYIGTKEQLIEAGLGSLLDYYDGSWCMCFSEEDMGPEDNYIMNWNWTEGEVY